MMMKKNLMKTALFIGLSFVLVNCKKNKDDAPTPQSPNEQEQITTLHLIVKDGGVLVDTFSFRDLDGPGGNAPTIETIELLENKSYTATLLLLDESKNPDVNISDEVAEEKNEHQFFYEVTTANLTVQYDDADDNGVPLGLETLMNTAGTNTGTLRVTLKHQPGVKPTTGNGDITLGDTDVEVEFDVNINLDL
jgi:hypothetical protein